MPDDPRPVVLLVGPAIHGAGAQRRFSYLVRYLFGGDVLAAVMQHDDTALLVNPPRRPLIDLRWSGTRSYPRMIRQVRSVMKNENVDVVFGFGLYPAFVSWMAISLLPPSARPAFIVSEINSPRREHLETSPRWRAALNDFIRRRMYPAATIYTANSLDGVAEAIEWYGVKPHKSRRVPNLIDIERLRGLARWEPPLDDPRPDDKRVASICIVGRLFRRKRVDTLLRAAALLDKGLDWRIDVVGDGEDRPNLMALADELGIASRVVFHGWLENPFPLIANADMMVLCSEFEGFSNSLLEAMALDVPVITSLNTADAKDMCARGAALGFPVGRYDILRDHIETLLRNGQRRLSLVQTARRYIQRHLLANAIREYESLIMDAFERRGARSHP